MRAIFSPSRTRQLGLLVAALALAGCGAMVVSQRPCPQVSEFSPALQRQAAEELTRLPPGSALEQILNITAVDRAFNRAVCR
jgi:hypothetical protein